MTNAEAAHRLISSRLLHRIAAAWDGGRLYLTGGSLRDRLLGVATNDVDLVAEGDPAEAAAALARSFRARAFRLGRPPSVTWRVAAKHLQLDVVGIDTNLETDILRRDFSVNAMFWRLPRGPLLDLVGGLDDLAAGRIRVVRAVNLRTDPLRVLRAFRLVATRPSLRLTADSESQLSAAAAGLPSVASERIVEELRLLLGGPGTERAILGAARCNALGAVIPGWGASEQAKLAASLAARLALLAAGRGALAVGAADVAPAVLALPASGLPQRWVEAAAADALARVGWPRRAAQRAMTATSYGEALASTLASDAPAARALAADAGPLLAPALAWALARNDGLAASHARALLRWYRKFAKAPPLLSGAEIAELCRLPAGPRRSEAVRSLRVARARGEVRTHRQAVRWLLDGG